jgi:GNAT superfamily N-acetyltransferase
LNPKQPSFEKKINWLKERFKEGLVIKLVYPSDSKKAIGYIEYVPGRNNWRSVYAPHQMFIHCIWVNSVKYRNQGIASLLLKECYQEAIDSGLKGVAVLTSGDAFMADKTLFLKNGFRIVGSAKPKFDLLVKQADENSLPKINEWDKDLSGYTGLNIVYSEQCPWVARFIFEVEEVLKEYNLKCRIKLLKTAAEAQQSPSPYSVFCLINNGKILADHYISLTRLKNILKKEKLI